MSKITDKEFIAKLKQVEKLNTVYGWGTFGQKLTYSLIDYKTKQYPRWYNSGKTRELRSLVGRGYFAIDCIGLIKAVHWGFPNLQYASGGMPDTNANGYIKQCREVSTNFSNIVPGEVVWLTGHIGVYIGNGLVIESTPSWKNGVQYTKLSQRKWLKHGKMPQVIYGGKEIVSGGTSDVTFTDKLNIDGSLGPNTIKALQRYFGLPIVDGIISTPRSNLIIVLQKALNVPQSGALDVRTIKSLQKHLGTSQDGVISKPRSLLIEELQRALNNGYLNLRGEVQKPTTPTPTPPVVDTKLVITGKLDKPTIKAWQKAFGMSIIDGEISETSNLIKELQKRLNENKI